jgi:hypothetical protein
MRGLRQGELSMGDLQILATEHDHVVVAKAVVAYRGARLATGILRDRLAAIAVQAADDVERWRCFSTASGWCPSSAWRYRADPFPETVDCATAVAGSRSAPLADQVARVYAIATAHRDLAPVQARALSIHYGFGPTATDWFARRSADRVHDGFLHDAVEDLARAGRLAAIVHAVQTTCASLETFYDGLVTHLNIRQREDLQ